MDELWPAVWHHVERYTNNRVEANNAQLKRWLRPIHGIKPRRRWSTRPIRFRSSALRFAADEPDECWQSNVTHCRLADAEILPLA